MKINQQYFLADVILGVYVHALYKFTCAGCNAYYVGETTRHFVHEFASTMRQTRLCIFTILLPRVFKLR